MSSFSFSSLNCSYDIESTEHIIRTIEAREGKTRHSFQGIGHTTYLCFARKAFFGTKRKTTNVKISKSKESYSESVKKVGTSVRARSGVKAKTTKAKTTKAKTTKAKTTKAKTTKAKTTKKITKT